jgi:hypothetical protein
MGGGDYGCGCRMSMHRGERRECVCVYGDKSDVRMWASRCCRSDASYHRRSRLQSLGAQDGCWNQQTTNKTIGREGSGGAFVPVALG